MTYFKPDKCAASWWKSASEYRPEVLESINTNSNLGMVSEDVLMKVTTTNDETNFIYITGYYIQDRTTKEHLWIDHRGRKIESETKKVTHWTFVNPTN